MEEVAAGRADYAVLPIENSTAGIVADIYDLLTEYNLFIVGEQILKVEHVLLGLQEAEPVSYTHLDVYKRQALCKTRRGEKYFSIPGRSGCYV